MILFKKLFLLLFLMFAASTQAQPLPPARPLYDPQGRLIPYDPPQDEAEAAPKSAKAKASSKRGSGSKASPTATSKKKAAQNSKKSSKKVSKKTKAGKPSAKATKTGKKK
jgi:hypothetical protein